LSPGSFAGLGGDLMPWEKLKPTQSFAETATLRKDGIALSGKFVESKNLVEYDLVELFVDDTLQRIGFKFLDVETADAVKLTKESRKGRIICAKSRLREHKWIADILEEPTSHRRFLIETDESVKDPTAGVRYYISIGYRFQPKREFQKQGDYPRLPGVYRLYKDGEIVRIGESDNLEGRLKEHFRSHKGRVDEYDFAEIQDSSARKLEEKRLLEEFRDAYGRLPKLNPIAA
jgi:hypothetical protein